MHQPQLPGFSYPLPVALVELEEGVRLLGNVVGMDPEALRIGMPLAAEFTEVEPATCSTSSVSGRTEGMDFSYSEEQAALRESRGACAPGLHG